MATNFEEFLARDATRAADEAEQRRIAAEAVAQHSANVDRWQRQFEQHMRALPSVVQALNREMQSNGLLLSGPATISDEKGHWVAQFTLSRSQNRPPTHHSNTQYSAQLNFVFSREATAAVRIVNGNAAEQLGHLDLDSSSDVGALRAWFERYIMAAAGS